MKNNIASSHKRRISLKSINSFITCRLCHGYFIDAVSISECLHSFCKSCLLQYLEDNHHCPICQTLIHQSHPLNFVSIDRTLQEIVYKVVPNLKNSEIISRQRFYRKRGISPPPNDEFARPQNERPLPSTSSPSRTAPHFHTKVKPEDRSPSTSPAVSLSESAHASSTPRNHAHIKEEQNLSHIEKSNGSGDHNDPGTTPPATTQNGASSALRQRLNAYLGLPDQLNVCLEPEDESIKPLNYKYLRLSSLATISHLKKFIALKVLNDISKFKEIDITFMGNGQRQVLGKDHSLKFIAIMHWRLDDVPLPLHYSTHISQIQHPPGGGKSNSRSAHT